MAGDQELIDYLQRLSGYALTGSTAEHVLAFFYGTGRNGKSTFLETIAGILGDYAVSTPMEAFIETKADRHPTDLAMMAHIAGPDQGGPAEPAHRQDCGSPWAGPVHLEHPTSWRVLSLRR